MVAIVASCNMLRAPRVHGAGLGGEAAAPTVPVRPNTTNADPSASTRFILSPLICGPLEPSQCRVAALPACGSQWCASEQLLSRSPRISWKTGRCGVANAGAVARGWSLGLAKDPSWRGKRILAQAALVCGPRTPHRLPRGADRGWPGRSPSWLQASPRRLVLLLDFVAELLHVDKIKDVCHRVLSREPYWMLRPAGDRSENRSSSLPYL